MKKCGSKKLQLSLKATGGNQQKISSFFIPSQKSNLKYVVRTEESQNESVNNQCPASETPSRFPGEDLCAKCLEKSPTLNSGVCTQCNITKNNEKTKEKIATSKSLKPSPTNSPCKSKDFNSINDVLSSPDIVPPTPPMKNKNKSSVKPAKRKCTFENEMNLKKKNTLSPNKPQVNSISNQTILDTSFSKENRLVNHKQRHNTSNKSMNPFKKQAVAEFPVSERLEDAVKLNETTAESLKTFQISNEPYPLHSNKAPNIDQGCKIKCNERHTVSHSQSVSCGQRKNTTNFVMTDFNETKNTNEMVTSVVEEEAALNQYQLSDTGNKLPSPADSNYKGFTQNSDSNYQIEDVSMYFLDDAAFIKDNFKAPIRLDSNTRCMITSVEHLKECGEVVLALQPSSSAQDGGSVTCVLRGSWADSIVSVGDVVNVTARPLEGQDGCWVVDNNSGLFVSHPDTLISGTTVVGSMFCKRRSVLSDMYRGIDSDSSIMVIGSFLHQLLQEVLKRKVSTLHDIEKVLDEFIKTRYFIFNLYSSSMSMDKTVETLKEFVPKIHGFVQKYLPSGCVNSATKAWNVENSWNGVINEIADIEENIWSPNLGLKGKIDVTVKTSSKNYKDKVMPLELKTGRASFSAEHRGQVILYTMMMSELGKSVDSGLLLYLREGVMKEVPVGAVERRDLILLRNDLVAQLKASHEVVVNSSQEIAAPALPPPIHHHSACGKCPYLTLCSAALRVSGCNKVSEKNPLRQLVESSTSHLEMSHIVYVFHWTGLLRLEHTEALLNSLSLHHIWTLPPADRAKRGTCIPNVKLVDKVVEVALGSYKHVFLKDDATAMSASEGEYMIVSSASRPAIAAGPVTQVSQTNLTLLLERDLSSNTVGESIWYLDKYESQSGLTFNMTNLGCLLENTDQAERLRNAVIDLKLPDIKPKLSSRVLKASVDLLSGLNDQQRKAIFRALAANHYILIKGMPGTGKTATIAALVQLAVRLGLSVLVTSHTHSAVDNVLLRLRGKVDLLRLGAAHKLHPDLVQYGEPTCSFPSPDNLDAFYNSKKVVGVTCLGSSHSLLVRRKFDFCIVDEATQVLQPTVLRSLFSAHKFILIGDPNQLPPLVRSSKAKKLGLGESLFARLDRPAVTSELNLQYRMNQMITDLANCLTYSGRLQCGSDQVANATLNLPPSVLDGELEWLRVALSCSLAKAVVVVDTGDCEAIGCVNTREADIVLTMLATLAKGLSTEQIGVIAPYRAQVEHLRQRVKSLSSYVEVNTVDQYQGRDKDVIIYSCTRSSKPKESDILGDKNRLTVAVTRARHKLIIVGNVTLLRSYSIFDQLFNFLPSSCIVNIS